MTDEPPDCHTFPASVFADFIFDQCADALASGCESDCDEAREWIAEQVAKRDARPVEDELRAGNERLRRLVSGLCRRYRRARSEAVQADGDFWALSKCTDEAKVYIGRLRGVLEPFAHCWQSVAQGKHSFDRTGEVPVLNTKPCGQCNGCRARAALEDTKGAK